MLSHREHEILHFGAIEQSDGSYIDLYGNRKWFNEEGRLHRDDGPASVLTNGQIRWWINGQYYISFKSWLEHSQNTDETKMMLRLCYG
jgi:hypothetical protein